MRLGPEELLRDLWSPPALGQWIARRNFPIDALLFALPLVRPEGLPVAAPFSPDQVGNIALLALETTFSLVALAQGKLGRRDEACHATICMDTPAYAIGQAVFIRTDTADYAEEVITFRNLEEMVRIASQSHPNLVLEKVIVYAMAEGEPCALTLGFIAATKGQRPSHPEFET